MCSKLLLGSSPNYYWVQAQNYKKAKCGVVRLKPKKPTMKTETHNIRNRKNPHGFGFYFYRNRNCGCGSVLVKTRTEPPHAHPYK